jgi:tetratricopeptide (TPR) repeat protein
VAKKKLNKKVAIIGTLALALLLVVFLVVLLSVTRNPTQYATKGDTAVAKGDYIEAKRCYGTAYERYKELDKKNEMLFKLAEVHKITGDWDKARGCWNKIAVADKTNVPAREYMLNFYYDYCDSGGFSGNVWNNVVTTAGELIALKPSAELYMRRGRGELEIAKAGGTVEQDKKLEEAIADLKKAKELDPKLAAVYDYLFQAYVVKSDMYRQKGVAKERADEALAQASKVADEAIKAAPDSPSGYISKLMLKLAAAEDVKQVEAMASDFQSLTTQFPKSSAAYNAMTRYYGAKLSLFIPNIDKVVAAAQKSFDVDTTANNALVLCDVYYRRAYLKKDVKDIDAAIDTAAKALTLPDAEVTKGPRGEGNKRGRRLSLYSFLAVCYIDKAMEWDPDHKQDYVKKAEDAAANMEQIFGSGDNHYVLMWHGILAYAMGQKAEGQKRMYAAYSQFKAADEWNPQSGQVAYWLSRAYADSDETGVVYEFLTNAIKGTSGPRGAVRPELVLDFADIVLKLRIGEYAVSVLDQYDNAYGVSDRSRSIRAQAYLASNKLEDAAKLLDKMPQDSATTLKLRLQMIDTDARTQGLGLEIADANDQGKSAAKRSADIDKYIEKRMEVLNKLLTVAPKEVDAVQLLGVANHLTRKGRLDEARKMVNTALTARPEDTALQLLQLRLNEPDPLSVSPERGKEMTLKVFESIKDPYTKAMSLGAFYAGNKQTDAALDQYAKAIAVKPGDAAAINASLDIAVQTNDTKRVSSLVAMAKAADLDQCKGLIYEARQAMMDKKYDVALPLLDKCIEERPIYSLAYLFRSDVKDKLGQTTDSIADAEKAATLNPLGGQVTKQLAVLLEKRNEGLGERATADQVQQARDALVRAIAANPNDTALLTFYVQGLSADRPDAAFANMHHIYKVTPTTENAAKLAQMGVKLAPTVTDDTQRAAIMQIVGSTLEEAYKKDPANRDLVMMYAEYYRLSGQPQKAEALVKSAKSDDIAWRYYLTAGQLDQAKAILLKLYKDDPKDIEALKGLVVAAQRSENRSDSIDYSRKLIELQDDATTRLNLIQMYVTYNMAADAYKEMDAFSAKYPEDYRGDLLRALMLMSEGKYSESRDMTNKVLQKNQNEFGAWRLKGELDIRLGDLTQAIVSLQKSKLLNDSAAIRLSLAQAFVADGRMNDAIEELRGGLSMEQGPQDVASTLERLYIQSNRVNDLKALYDSILKIYPTNYIWLTKAAGMYAQLGERDKALDYFKRAWRASEEAGVPYDGALSGWLTSLLAGGQYSDVIAFASKYTDGKLATVAYLNMGIAAYKLNDKANAMKYFENALEKSIDDSTVTFGVVDRMYATMGQAESTAWCNQRLEKDPKNLVANVAMYNLLLRGGKSTESRKYGAIITDLVGPKTDAGLAYRINDADILLKAYTEKRDAGIRDEAIKELSGLAADLETRPALLAKVLNNLAYMLAESGNRMDEAAKAIQRAFDTAPYDGNILDTYAYVLYQQGKYKEAKEKDRAAIQMFEKANTPVPFDASERLAQACEKLGEKQEAIAAYKRAIELGGRDLPAEKAAELNAAVKRLSTAK